MKNRGHHPLKSQISRINCPRALSASLAPRGRRLARQVVDYIGRCTYPNHDDKFARILSRKIHARISAYDIPKTVGTIENCWLSVLCNARCKHGDENGSKAPCLESLAKGNE